MEKLSATETYLQDFHRRMPGASSTAFGNLRARSSIAQYASSYDALASCVPASHEPLTVLDLACGDGYLLKLLGERQPSLQLIGVDMSQYELDIARATLPGNITLLRERAQSLSIETASVDCVTSHMALMLMDDIGQVLSEVRRVLRHGGQFAAMMGRSFLLGEVSDIFNDVFRPVAKKELLPLPFGDPRTRKPEGWMELLSRDFDDIQFENIDVDWAPLPTELWNALMETYDIDRLNASAQQNLRAHFLDAMTPIQQSDGTLRTGWGLFMVRARAATHRA